jgi:thioester reductase-like protein
MADPRRILLTGATGLLGRYLLRDLVASGRLVSVLVRDARATAAAERVAELTALWSERLAKPLPAPVVLAGDLRCPGLGLGAADRRWAASHAAVVHAAASVVFRATPDGEPESTNVLGTRRLTELCRSLAVGELHHVSTAFVCGDRADPVREDELDCGQNFHNAYERSKFEAERHVRSDPGLRVTVYRPSVIIGDSRTGYTSTYQGIYPFLELGTRLARPGGGRPDAARALPLRLPLTGDEPRDLVPVDWVARAVVHIANRPRHHGRTYHLVAGRPVPVRRVKEVAEEVLGIGGVEFAGPDGPADPTALEQLFLEHVREYLPYLQGDPVFDARNSRAALRRLPPPAIDRALLARVIAFAARDRWGHRSSSPPAPAPEAAGMCGHYMERFFPQHARRSALARAVNLDALIAFDVHGPAGGQWSCRWTHGELVSIRRGLEPGAEVTYRTDPATFAAVVQGVLVPQEAFFARRIEIAGDLEKALKLAVLFGQFVREFPFPPGPPRRLPDGLALTG